MDFFYSELSKGKPVIAMVNGNSQHYVTVVGFKNVTSTGTLSESNFLIIDPAGSSYSLENLSKYHLISNSHGYQTVYDTSSAKASFSSTSISGVTVTFNANGGSCFTSSLSVSKGGSISSLPTPTRAGYSFDGWYTGGGTKITTSTTFSTNATVYAHWNELHKISFETNGGAFANTASSIKVDLINQPRPDYSVVIYNKAGTVVDTDKWGYDAAIDRNGRVTDLRGYGDDNKHLTVPEGGFVLSAQSGKGVPGAEFVMKIEVGDYVAFNESTMTVYHYTDFDEYLSQNKYTADTELYGELPTPDRQGFLFGGWADENGSIVSFDSAYSSSKLSALWIDMSFPEGYSGWSDVIPEYVSSESYDIITKTLYHYRRTGKWSAWSETKPAEQSGIEIGSLTLYTWKLKTYQIGFDANGGSGAPQSITKIHGTECTIDSTVPTRSGFNFLGWSTVKDGAIAYQPGSSYTANCSVTLYARWEPNHSHSYTPNVTSPASCTAEGVMTYSCGCGDSYTEPIPVKEHDYGVVFNWSGHSCSAYIKCNNCTASSAIACEVTEKVIKEPTTSSTGTRLYTANASYGSNIYTHSISETIPMLGNENQGFFSNLIAFIKSLFSWLPFC